MSRKQFGLSVAMGAIGTWMGNLIYFLKFPEKLGTLAGSQLILMMLVPIMATMMGVVSSTLLQESNDQEEVASAKKRRARRDQDPLIRHSTVFIVNTLTAALVAFSR